MTPKQRTFLGLLIIPVVIVLDQVTKAIMWADPRMMAPSCLERALEIGGTDRNVCGAIEVSPIFDFTMVWNLGMSFGMLQSQGIMRWILVGVTLAIACGFAVWAFRATNRLLFVALALVVSGAIGNVIDRVRFGAVLDFVDVSGFIPFFPWVFNVADSAITVGAILLLADQFIFSAKEDTVSSSGQASRDLPSN